MHVGLDRILDLIRVNPNDTLLVDRFLILAADLKEEERASVTLSLSEALLRKNPRRAIELAHMVYRVRPGETEPLELMVEGLENLGRYGKATVLRQHLENVKKAKATNPGVAKKAVEESMAAIDRELLMMGQPVKSPPKTPVGPSQKKAAVAESPRSEKMDVPLKQNKPVDPYSETIADAPVVDIALSADIPPPPQKFADMVSVSQFSLLDADQEAQPTAANEVEPKVEINFASLGIFAGELAAAANEEQKSQAIVPQLDGFQSGRGGPEPRIFESPSLVLDSPPSQPLLRRDGIPSMVPDAPEFEEAGNLQGTYAHSKEIGVPRFEETSAALKQIQVAPARELAASFSRLIAAQHWESLWGFISHDLSGGIDSIQGAEIYRLAAASRLYRIDSRFLGWWLDCLILDRRPRQALALAVKTLREQPHLGIATIVYPRMQSAAAALGMIHIEWSEQEGVLNLLKRAELQKLESAASMAIFDGRSA